MLDWFECDQCRKTTLILPEADAKCPHCGNDGGRVIVIDEPDASDANSTQTHDEGAARAD